MKKALTIILALVLVTACLTLPALAAETASVGTEDELRAALEEGVAEITVTRNITLTDTVNITGAVTLDLGGKTLTLDPKEPLGVENLMDAIYIDAPDCKVTIKNGAVKAVFGSGDAKARMEGIDLLNGDLTLKDLTVTGDLVAVITNDKVSAIEDCTLQAYEFKDGNGTVFCNSLYTSVGTEIDVIRDSKLIGITTFSGYSAETEWSEEQENTIAEQGKNIPPHVALIENCEFSYPVDNVDIVDVRVGATVDEIKNCTFTSSNKWYGVNGLVVNDGGSIGKLEKLTFNMGACGNGIEVRGSGSIGSIADADVNLNGKFDENYGCSAIRINDPESHIGEITGGTLTVKEWGEGIFCGGKLDKVSKTAIKVQKTPQPDKWNFGINAGNCEIGVLEDLTINVAGMANSDDGSHANAISLYQATVDTITGIKANASLNLGECTVGTVSDSTFGGDGVGIGNGTKIDSVSKVTLESGMFNVDGISYDENGQPTGETPVTIGSIDGLTCKGGDLRIATSNVGDMKNVDVNSVSFEGNSSVDSIQNLKGDINTFEDDSQKITIGNMSGIQAPDHIVLQNAACGDITDVKNTNFLQIINCKMGNISDVKCGTLYIVEGTAVESLSNVDVDEFIVDSPRDEANMPLKTEEIGSVDKLTARGGIICGGKLGPITNSSFTDFGEISNSEIESISDSTFTSTQMWHDEESGNEGYNPAIFINDSTVGNLTNITLTNGGLSTAWGYTDENGKPCFPKNVIGNITNMTVKNGGIDFGGEGYDGQGNIDMTVYNTVGNLTNVNVSDSIILRCANAGDIRGCSAGVESSEEGGDIWLYNTDAGVICGNTVTWSITLESSSAKSIRDNKTIVIGIRTDYEHKETVGKIIGNYVEHMNLYTYPASEDSKPDKSAEYITVGEISGNTVRYAITPGQYVTVDLIGENNYVPLDEESDLDENGKPYPVFIEVLGHVKTIIADLPEGKHEVYVYDKDMNEINLGEIDCLKGDTVEVYKGINVKNLETKEFEVVGTIDSIEAPEKPVEYSDVKSTDWFASVVDYATSHNIMGGTGDGFNPNKVTTRGTVFTILARAAGEDATPAAGEQWYQKGLDWSVKVGASDGTNPNDYITREQLAVILYRLAGSPAVKADLSGFTDADQIHDWTGFPEAMAWAVSEGIVTGNNNALNPLGTATRVEAAAMIMRFVEKGYMD